MNILEYFDKNNLHHAYLIEGAREEIVPEILKFVEILGIDIVGNPDFYHMSLDSFKVDDARNLKSISLEKGFSSNKKIFLISVNNFLLEAQNTLLKVFEEPIENTHFFLITPNTDILQKTFISRFYLIKSQDTLQDEIKKAQNFIKMSKRERIDFLKELLIKEDESTEINLNSVYLRAFKFLNALESVLYHRGTLCKNTGEPCGNYFEQIFKVRKFISQPGSSVKTLMESIALSVPNF